jgi:aryl-alcohol dehydrogenase-like predicted oxidoreductase
MALARRRLGTQGLEASALGLGCMGMSAFYVTPEQALENESESLRVFDVALEQGLNFLDTSDIYGPFTNEVLLGKAIKGRRDKFIVCTKFGIIATPEGGMRLDSSRKHVREACEASLKRLGVDCIDLYYQHRVDPKTPIEETMEELKLLVQEGKIKYIGLAEAGANIIRRAHKIHPISAVQLEWSIWTRDIEKDLLPTLRELGIGIVAYSPLGRGFLTGKVELAENDWRKTNPRFAEEAMKRNTMIVDKVKAVAERHGCNPAQIALAWVLHQGPDVVPIPGTKRVKYLLENLGSLKVKLSPEDLKELDVPESDIVGARYAQSAGTYKATESY